MSASQRFCLFGLLSSLAWLWFILINHLRIEWTLNPQYSYGWAVPFLGVYLIWQKRRSTWTDNVQRSTLNFQPSHRPPSSIVYCLFAVSALLYALTRLIQEANPDWRLVSWALAFEVIGVTLCVLRLVQSAFPLRLGLYTSYLGLPPEASALRSFAFPICFFLVAVPWPTLVEGPLIQTLTRAISAITIELLGFIGVPAIQQGNVIELSTGLLGIDEACNAIPSLQATLMISLFLGEIYRLTVSRRLVFCLTGFAIAFLFNVGRTLLLTLVAARKGIPAVASWHDPAGVTILVGCFLSLWCIGVWLAKGGRRKAESGGQRSEIRDPTAAIVPRSISSQHSTFTIQLTTFALCAWLIAVEVSVEGWYRFHESKLPVTAQWTVIWPTNNATFKDVSFAPKTRQILRYDEGRHGTWTDGDRNWQAIFLRWNPGQTALYLVRNHTPEGCLTASGRKLVSTSELQRLDIHGLQLPFRAYEFSEAGQPFRVYYCLWNDRTSEQGFKSQGLDYISRLEPILAGNRNAGQRSLEIAVRGIASPDEVETVMRRELEKLINVAKPPPIKAQKE